MSVRPILQIGHPRLREQTVEVAPAAIETPAIQGLIGDLIDTMRNANGAGIAAPQIGRSERITVIEVRSNTRYPYKPPIPLTIAINPRVTLIGDETVEINEGCLSVPLRGVVRRHVTISVTYLDQHGTEHIETKQGLTAGTWQHEVDHLDGVLFIDRVEDPTTLTTWDNFTAFHRDAFVERITTFVDRIGS